MLDAARLPPSTSRHWQPLFLAILPTIQNCVAFAFRHVPPEEREELIQESLANAAVACANLVGQGRADRVFPSALANFAVRRTREGRKVGSKLNSRDVLSDHCRRKRHFVVKRLDYPGSFADPWRESVVEDHRTPVPEQVAFRLDFPEWLACFSARQQEIALALAMGRGTVEVARSFAISPARVSQLRREFHQSWNRFHAETEPPSPPHPNLV